LINRRIVPIIEQHISESQMVLEKARERDAIFKLRMVAERAIQVDEKVLCMFCGLPESI